MNAGLKLALTNPRAELYRKGWLSSILAAIRADTQQYSCLGDLCDLRMVEAGAGGVFSKSCDSLSAEAEC
jgi:hypothetical protein